MTRKDLEERFVLFGHNDNISLYRKRTEETVFGYCGSIRLERGKATFNGHVYADVDSLDSALTEWGEALEWPVTSYDPMLNDTYRLESRLITWLEDKMHFKQKEGTWERGNTYIRKIGPGFEIFFTLDRSMKDDKVQIYSKYAGMSIMQDVSTPEEGVAVMSSFIRSTILTMATDIIDALADCPEADNAEIRAFVASKNNIFGFEEVDYKKVMISELEKQLKKLKGE